MGKTFVSIKKWWLTDTEGQPLSVYAVHRTIEGTENALTRHTLTRAKEGKLEKGDFGNLKTLARLCSIWSGQKVTIDDLIVEEEAE